MVLTGAGRGLSLTERTARRLPTPAPVLELDVTRPEHGAAVTEWLRTGWGTVDGALHSIGFAPPACLGGDFMAAGWDGRVGRRGDLGVLAEDAGRDRPAAHDRTDGRRHRRPRLRRHRGVARLRLDGRGEGSARVDGALPGPRSRPSGRPGEPGGGGADQDDGRQVDPRLLRLRGRLARAAPLGWDCRDSGPVARACVALLSDWFPATTARSSTSTAGTTPWGCERRSPFRKLAAARRRRGRARVNLTRASPPTGGPRGAARTAGREPRPRPPRRTACRPSARPPGSRAR